MEKFRFCLILLYYGQFKADSAFQYNEYDHTTGMCCNVTRNVFNALCA